MRFKHQAPLILMMFICLNYSNRSSANNTSTTKVSFKDIVQTFKAELFRGRAQDFSAFNLDLQTFIHLRVNSLEGAPHPYTFDIASDGNQIINGVPVWPIKGYVTTELPQNYILDGTSVQFSSKAGIFYFIESEQSHSERMKRWAALQDNVNYQDYLRAMGLMVGVANMDVQTLSIDFYQVVPETSELKAAGVFSGAVALRLPRAI